MENCVTAGSPGSRASVAAAAQRVGRCGHRLEAHHVFAGRREDLRRRIALLEMHFDPAAAAGHREHRAVGHLRRNRRRRSCRPTAVTRPAGSDVSPVGRPRSSRPQVPQRRCLDDPLGAGHVGQLQIRVKAEAQRHRRVAGRGHRGAHRQRAVGQPHGHVEQMRKREAGQQPGIGTEIQFGGQLVGRSRPSPASPGRRPARRGWAARWGRAHTVLARLQASPSTSSAV